MFYFLVKHKFNVHKRHKIPNKLLQHFATGKLSNMNLFELQLCLLYKQHDDKLTFPITLFVSEILHVGIKPSCNTTPNPLKHQHHEVENTLLKNYYPWQHLEILEK